MKYDNDTIKKIIYIYFASYAATFVIMGVWDPNGAILSERSFSGILFIVLTGMVFCIPLGLSVFLSSHPYMLIMGIGFVAIGIVGWRDRKDKSVRNILYIMLSTIICLGTVHDFLLA